MNLQYPRFTGSPSFVGRAGDIAKAVRDSGADSAVFCEGGYNECRRLAPGLPGWEYDRSQGRAAPGAVGEGLNSVWSDPAVWARSRLADYNLNSFGQWQRTALGVRLEEVADRSAFAMPWAVHFAAKGSPLGRLGADRALAAQIRQLERLVGERRSIWMGDVPRTNSADDVTWLKRQGYRGVQFSQTPLAVLFQGAVTLLGVERKPHGRLFDHDYLVATWSVAGKRDA